ncbi:unnamed protein product [Lactuca saligna]|uniref:Uncharacterized protein n=1 Tax=Lactuca saligna TaxID=75948 RepID=A0AA35YJD4_LACSI|nr:unnamed protein product [Lactuca saligna]
MKKVPQRSGSKHHKATPYSLRSFQSKIMKDAHNKKQKKESEKKDYKDARCSVYLYKKAYSKEKEGPESSDGSNVDPFVCGLMCPLCCGQVKGWTVVERARKFLNSKKRSCMQDNCSFVRSYRDLRKHVREDHPLARPREVDPSLAEKWKTLENDTELNDVMSTISSTMPESIVMVDYVIEGNFREFSRDMEMDNYLDNVLFRLGSRTAPGSYAILERGRRSVDDDDGDDGGGAATRRVCNYIPRIACRQGRLVLGGPRRRRGRGRGRGVDM